MSEENVELIRAGIEAMNRRDIDAVVVGMDPGVRFEHRLAALQGTFVGIEGVRRWFEDLAEHFGRWRVYCVDIRDLGDRVLALGTIRAIGRESGVETEVPFTAIARFKDGLITDFVDYGDRDQALEAAGLRGVARPGACAASSAAPRATSARPPARRSGRWNRALTRPRP